MTRADCSSPFSPCSSPRPAAQAIPQIDVTCNGRDCAGGWYRTVGHRRLGRRRRHADAGLPRRDAERGYRGRRAGLHRARQRRHHRKRTVPLQIDRTAPGVTAATPARPPDHEGWYTAPVTVAFSGSDALSGLASCTAGSYAGGDSAAASVTGTCTDVAGNRSAPFAFPLRYDATAPSTAGIGAQPGDRSVQLSLPGTSRRPSSARRASAARPSRCSRATRARR